MADIQSAVDGAVQTTAGVANQAASGNVWAFGVFVVLVAASLTALWVWRSTGAKPAAHEGHHDDDPDPPSCDPKGGCPGVRELALQVSLLAKELDHLSKAMEADREERRDHRSYVEGVVRDLHQRVDTILLGTKTRTA